MLARDDQQADRTHGRLYVDGRWQCFTLEDTVRAPGVKVQGETAIPAGRYPVVLEDSTRFGPDTLTLKDVPGFTHIRIHAGNTERETSGCLLVGQTRDSASIGHSRVALEELRRTLVPRLQAGEEAWIHVVDVTPPPGESP